MVILTADHAGYELKEKLKKYFQKYGIAYNDNGAHTKELLDDYPDYAKSASLLVLENENNKGVFICGSGIGMSIAANKVRGIRAAVAYNKKIAKLAVTHNNANVITIGGRFTSFWRAKSIVKTFINSQYEKGRHETRISKIKDLEC